MCNVRDSKTKQIGINVFRCWQLKQDSRLYTYTDKMNNGKADGNPGPSIKYTLMFLKRANKVLLGLKGRGLGKGYWNGLGGKVERGENPYDCIKREVKEEGGVTVNSLKHVGVMKYDVLEEHNLDSSLVFIFTSSDFTGEPKPTEEMNPVTWFCYDEIPYSNMWSDNVEWFPYMLQDKFFSIHCVYNTKNDKKSSTVLGHDSIDDAIRQCL